MNNGVKAEENTPNEANLQEEEVGRARCAGGTTWDTASSKVRARHGAGSGPGAWPREGASPQSVFLWVRA